MCRNIKIKFLSWAYMYIYTALRFLGKCVSQINQTDRQTQRDRDEDDVQ